MKVTVVGTDYKGIVTRACFSETVSIVTCIDFNKIKVDKLNDGQISVYETGLERIFLRNLKECSLKFTTYLNSAIKYSEIIFLASPATQEAVESADLKYVSEVANQIDKILDSYNFIVNRSTVPVGTAYKVKTAIAKNYKRGFDVVINPDFLKEGIGVDDFMQPDGVALGTRSERPKKLMSDL